MTIACLEKPSSVFLHDPDTIQEGEATLATLESCIFSGRVIVAIHPSISKGLSMSHVGCMVSSKSVVTRRRRNRNGLRHVPGRVCIAFARHGWTVHK